MSGGDNPKVGTIGWVDLTVPNADEVRDFYSQVTGWQPEPVSMGDYSDYTMITPTSGQAVAGVCHAQGVNAGLPAQWLIYIRVEDIEASMKQCVALGGKVIAGPKDLGEGSRYSVIQDPAGAVAALYETD